VCIHTASDNICIYIYVCIHRHIFIGICCRTHICMYVYMYIYVYTYIHTYVCK